MEFQILAFQHHQGFSTLRPNGNYWISNDPNDHTPCGEIGATLDYMLNHWLNPNNLQPEWIKIYSVKRLSDGEIFTIGDTVDDFYDVCIINGFELDESYDFGLKIVFNQYQSASLSVITKVHTKLNA